MKNVSKKKRILPAGNQLSQMCKGILWLCIGMIDTRVFVLPVDGWVFFHGIEQLFSLSIYIQVRTAEGAVPFPVFRDIIALVKAFLSGIILL